MVCARCVALTVNTHTTSIRRTGLHVYLYVRTVEKHKLVVNGLDT